MVCVVGKVVDGGDDGGRVQMKGWIGGTEEDWIERWIGRTG